MSVTRSQLRKLRNKVYIRILSRQPVQNQIRRYESLTELFIEKSDSENSLDEIAAFRRRVKITEKAAAAAAAASKKSIDIGDQILLRLKRLREQSQGNCSSMHRKVLNRLCSDLDPILCSTTLTINQSRDKTSCLQPTIVPTKFSIYRYEQKILTSSTDILAPPIEFQDRLSLLNSGTMASTEAAREFAATEAAVEIAATEAAAEIAAATEAACEFAATEAAYESAATEAAACDFAAIEAAVSDSTATEAATELTSLTSLSTVPDSAAYTSACNKVESSQMDTLSEAMANLITFSMSSENHDMVRLFVEELQDTMRLSTEVTTVSADISVTEELFVPALRRKAKSSFWTRLKNIVLG